MWTKCVQRCAAFNYLSHGHTSFILFSTHPSLIRSCMFLRPTHKTSITIKDAAARLKSSMYIWDCARGLAVVCRFEWFPPAKIQLDWSLGWEMPFQHIRNTKKEQICILACAWIWLKQLLSLAVTLLVRNRLIVSLCSSALSGRKTMTPSCAKLWFPKRCFALNLSVQVYNWMKIRQTRWIINFVWTNWRVDKNRRWLIPLQQIPHVTANQSYFMHWTI